MSYRRLCNALRREEGFWSSLVLIFLVTLSLMGLGAYVLIRGEGVNTGRQIQSFQSEYSATGAAYYGIARMKTGGLTAGGSEALTIGSASVSLSAVSVSASTVHLTVTSTVDDIDTEITVEMQIVNLADVAVWTTGNVTDVRVLDESGTQDDNMLISDADSLPAMDTAALSALATTQGNYHGSSYTPPNGYPSTSFFNSGSTPNVTYVDGDLTIENGRTVYGIFVVTGSVTVKSKWGSIGRIEGIVYLPNESSTVTMSMEGMTSIRGGVLSGGHIDGTGWLDGTIQHNSTYMQSFASFRSYPSADGAIRAVGWSY
ncbi:MAG TPA: hypothetical protein ENN03_02125 [bacterium]|nr:hypothetical protein [bacterium]